MDIAAVVYLNYCMEKLTEKNVLIYAIISSMSLQVLRCILSITKALLKHSDYTRIR